MLIKPAPGFLIRDPVTLRLVPAEGAYSVDETDTFWCRALAVGDVVQDVEAEAAAAPAADSTSSPANAKRGAAASSPKE